jgi:hypothetical protein
MKGLLYTNIVMHLMYSPRGDDVLEQNKSLVCRFVDEMLNKQNPAVVDELVTPDFVDHDAPPEQIPGPAGVKRTLEIVIANSTPRTRDRKVDLKMR